MLLPLEADDNDPALCPLITGPPAANIGHPLPETLSIAEAKTVPLPKLDARRALPHFCN